VTSYVDDLCSAVLAAAERECAGQVFHVAAGAETEIGALAELMLGITGARVAIRREPARAGEVRRNCARIERAAAVLGYHPRTALADGLAATWRWFQAGTGTA